MSADLQQWRDQTPDAVWTEIERLKAELARLTPSGQVVESEEIDQETADEWVPVASMGFEAVRELDALQRGESRPGQVAEDARTVTRELERALVPPATAQALHRLATKAHGYEAKKAERDEARVALQEEREGFAMLTRDREQALKGRDAAVADNAALVDAVSAARLLVAGGDGVKALALLGHVRAQPHPGAALLKEHAQALVKARNEGLEDAARYCDTEADKRTATARALATCDQTPQVRHGHAIAEETATALAVAADDIRARKESES